jgi:hypothetical protein
VLGVERAAPRIWPVYRYSESTLKQRELYEKRYFLFLMEFRDTSSSFGYSICRKKLLTSPER